MLVAVDDVQWLDQPSATVPLYAARRVEDERIRFLVAQRAAADDNASLQRALGGSHLRRAR
jgi:hypothetical protein